MKRIKKGDLFEIKTSKGLSYIHYIYYDNELGELIRVLPGKYSVRPDNMKELVQRNELYVVFFSVSIAFKKGLIELVYNQNILNEKPKFMRTPHIIRNEFLGWHIINTDTWERKLVDELSPFQKKLSPWGIWNYTLLKERIEENWDLENWE